MPVDYGLLERLTPDQRYGMLQQLLVTIAAVDDPYMKRVAQQEIVDAATRRKETFKAIELAINNVRGEYVRELNAEVTQAVQEMVNSGELRLFSPADEANLVRDADHDARERLMIEAERNRGEVNRGGMFQVLGSRGKISVRVGDFEFDSRAKQLSAGDMERIVQHIYMLLHG